MLTLHDVEASYRQWADAHPTYAAQLNEEYALTLYLAGARWGVEVALEHMRLPPTGDMAL